MHNSCEAHTVANMQRATSWLFHTQHPHLHRPQQARPQRQPAPQREPPLWS